MRLSSSKSKGRIRWGESEDVNGGAAVVRGQTGRAGEAEQAARV